jgi:DNA-binding LacI/PurR family transcriptional regulator
MAAWPIFSLTSFSQPAEQMVAETLRLIHALRGDPEQHENVVTEGRLLIRTSTRPARFRQVNR